MNLQLYTKLHFFAVISGGATAGKLLHH